MKIALHALHFVAVLTIPLAAPGRAADAVPVTVDNFIRAEIDLYIGNAVKEGGLGKLNHRREPLRSTSKSSSGSTATRSIPRVYSTSMRARSRSRCRMRVSGSCRCR